MLIGMNLLMGSTTRESVAGISKCSGWWWSVQAVFIVICVLLTIVSVVVAKKETALKKKFGNVGICKSDLDLSENKTINMLLALGFGGGWLAGCVGLGGGAIYNPVLISLGIPPSVSSATGLYLVFFSKVASCFVYYLNGELDILYGLWIALWSTVGWSAHIARQTRASSYVLLSSALSKWSTWIRITWINWDRRCCCSDNFYNKTKMVKKIY